MNGPLLVSLLPPERIGETVMSHPDRIPYGIAFLLLAGIVLALRMRRPER
jgi:hypothetical protein